MDMHTLLAFSVEKKASDLHLSAGLAPRLRVAGNLEPTNFAVLSSAELENLLKSILAPQQWQQFEHTLELDFSLHIPSLARFRVNIFQQQRGLGAVFRIIPLEIKTVEQLKLPFILRDLVSLPRGLVLVTGPTGSGKSTTLAAMLDYVNQQTHQHIITIEDPIEFVHDSKQCLINQREVGRDTQSFNAALRAVLREDPDIILVGELRDLETIRLALTAAETGHLVLGSLHTTSAAKAIHRIVDVFPALEKTLIRNILAETLQAVVAQVLVNTRQQQAIAVHEIMVCNAAIRNLIREDKIAQIYSVLQTNKALGMQTLDQHLQDLMAQGIISLETAQSVAHDKQGFEPKPEPHYAF